MAGSRVANLVAFLGIDTSALNAGLQQAQGQLQQFGGRAGQILAAGGAAAGVALAAGVVGGMNVEAANDKLSAQLGLTGPESERIGRIAGQLYAGAYGESLEDVNEALSVVVRNVGGMASASDAELRSVTASVLDVATAFDQDLGGVATAVGQLMRTGMAPNAEAALDLITKGMQKGADASGDLLDSFTEYPALLQRLGLDGASSMGLIVQGMQAGARNADLVTDALKEFQIRATNGSTLSAEGFQMLGLSAAEMTAQIAAGGEGARAGLDVVLDRLRGIEDPVKRNAAAVALFGTQAEDLGGALFALDPSAAAAGLGELDGTVKALGETLSDNAANAIESFKRQAQLLVVGLAEFLLPAVNSISQTLAKEFGPAVVAVGEWIKSDLVPALKDLSKFISDNKTAFQIAAGVITGLFLPHLITLGVTATVTAAQVAAAWVVTQVRAVAAAVVHSAQVVLMVGRWVWLGAQALFHAARVAAAWTVVGARAAVTVAAHVAHVAAMVAGWALLGARALLHGARVVAGWVMVGASAIAAAAVHVAHVAVIVGGWVLLGAQSLLQAARVAAAWFIALGPVGWVIATVIALVALIIANWDTVKRVTAAVWEWVAAKVDATWEWIKGAVGDALGWVQARISSVWESVRNGTQQAWDAVTGAVRGALSGVKDILFTAVLWLVDKWSWFALKILEGADRAFGWVPGLGPKLEAAKKEMQKFRDGVNREMDGIRNKDIAVRVGVSGAWSMQNNGMGRIIGNVPEFASGGWTGPGPRLRPAGIVHADEFVVSARSRRRIESRAPGLLDHMNRTGGLPGFADGGVVSDLSPQARRAGAMAREGAREVTADALPRLAAEAARALRAVPQAPFPSSSAGLIPVMRAMKEFVTATWGIRNIGGYAYRNIGGTNKLSDHAMGKAIDIMHPGKALGDVIAGYFAGPGRAQWPVDNVIWWRRIWNARRGGWRGYSGQSPHTDHVHVDTFDDGGLARGAGMIPKGTLRPERVLDPGTTAAFERLVSVLDGSSLRAVRSQPVPVEKHLHYHAATGRSLPEEDFLDAAGRARVLGW